MVLVNTWVRSRVEAVEQDLQVAYPVIDISGEKYPYGVFLTVSMVYVKLVFQTIFLVPVKLIFLAIFLS